MINECLFVGNMGADPELRKTAGGISYVIFKMAVDVPKRGRLEEDSVAWPEFEVWGSAADHIALYCQKGTRLFVKSFIKEYVKKTTDQDGKEINRHIKRFRVENFVIL